MKSTTPSTRRSSLTLATTTALLLAGAPGYSHAKNLRRSSSPDMKINMVVNREGQGIEVVSSNEFFHEPVVVEENRTEFEEKRRAMLQLEKEKKAAAVEPKEYINDESRTLVDPEDSKHQRREQNCASDEKLWIFRFRTDNYGYETSWTLEKQDENNNWSIVSEGPPGDNNYDDNTLYVGTRCLQGDNMYKLSIIDEFSDGMCCSYGSGTYSYTVDGSTEYDSNGEHTFTDQADHVFYVGLPTPTNSGNSADGTLPFAGRFADSSCPDDQHQQIRIKMRTDQYGFENSWELKSLDTNDVILSRPLNYYGDRSEDEVSACVPHGRYQFNITDETGDGICCRYGDGRYEIYMDDDLMINGSDFNHGLSKSHDIIVGYHDRYEEMNQREVQYLDCHNWRRAKYHERFGAQYVPLKYDISLAADAMSWAVELLNACDINDIQHEPGAEQGENLAKNRGTGDWGQLYPVENICRRWFEREETWAWPDNAHLTQGLWRSARYVGCADSEKVMDNGGMCRVQVCRYARAGNCNMGSYNSTEGDNWKIPMLMDHNPCGPACPPEGCH